MILNNNTHYGKKLILQQFNARSAFDNRLTIA